MTDFILVIRFDSADATLEDLLLARLYLSASSGNTAEDGSITAYFPSADDRGAALDALADVEGIEVELVERERVDWLDLYQQSLEPILIGDRFIIAPDASLLDDAGDRLTLVVPQEQAFGTGAHESTAMCIELLESLDLDGRNGLDVGAGSGILALAMLRLGAARAVAFDNDPDAYAALRDNRARNGIAAPQMALFIGGIESLRGGSFDVVTMNIIPEVILPILPDVVVRMAPGGHLIVSGVLLERAGEILARGEECGLRLAGSRSKGEWWAGLLERES